MGFTKQDRIIQLVYNHKSNENKKYNIDQITVVVNIMFKQASYLFNNMPDLQIVEHVLVKLKALYE